MFEWKNILRAFKKIIRYTLSRKNWLIKPGGFAKRNKYILNVRLAKIIVYLSLSLSLSLSLKSDQNLAGNNSQMRYDVLTSQKSRPCF